MNRDYRSSFQTIGRRFPLSQRERAGVRENCPNQNLHWFMESTQIETESISRSRIFWNGRKMSLLTELVFQHVHKTTSMPVLTDFISLHLCVNQSFKIKNLLQKIKTYSSNPIKPNQGFIDGKNSEFFSGHFYGKSLANPQKIPQKTRQISPKNLRFMNDFLQCQFINESQRTPATIASTTFHSSLFDPIRGVFLQKNSQFFYPPFSQNTGQNRQKAPKKPLKFAQKTRDF